VGVPDVYISLNPESGLQVQYRLRLKTKRGAEGVKAALLRKNNSVAGMQHSPQ